MPRLFLFSRITLEDQSPDHRNVPELSPGHFSSIHTSLNIGQQVIRTEQFVYITIIYRNRFITQQFKTIIIHGKRESDRDDLTDSVSKNCRHSLMYQPSFKWIHKEMKAILRFYMLDQQFIRLRNMGELFLQVEQGFQYS